MAGTVLTEAGKKGRALRGREAAIGGDLGVEDLGSEEARGLVPLPSTKKMSLKLLT